MIGTFLSLFLKKENARNVHLQAVEITDIATYSSEDDAETLQKKLISLFSQSWYYDITVLDTEGVRHWCGRISDVLALYRNGKVVAIDAIPKNTVDRVVESRIFAHCSW